MRAFVAFAACALAASQAAAVPVCADDDGAAKMSLAPDGVPDGAVPPDGVPPDGVPPDAGPAAEQPHIIPCAFADSGVFGQVCLDASGYLVTQSGVVLCEVRGIPDVSAVHLPDEVDPRPAAGEAPPPHAAHGALARELPSKRFLPAVLLGSGRSPLALGPGILGEAPPVPPA